MKNTGKAILLADYVRIANSGFESILQLLNTENPLQNLREIHALSEALFRLPFAPDAKLNIEKELTTLAFQNLVDKYPKYKSLMNHFLTITEEYELKK